MVNSRTINRDSVVASEQAAGAVALVLALVAKSYECDGTDDCPCAGCNADKGLD